jgi:uncharacterized protein YcbK (DUF882 family)
MQRVADMISQALFVIAICMAGGRLAAAPTNSKKDAATCHVKTFQGDLLRPKPSVGNRLPKRPKRFVRGWDVSKSQRLQPVTTTLYNIHTREAVPVLQGTIPPDEVLKEIFRCRGFAVRHPLDSRLVERVLAAAVHFDAPRVKIISAYRTPKFNESLQKKGRQVALNSHHTKGEAIDFALPVAHAKQVGAYIWRTFDGGVGIYSVDNFVHIDVGPKRRWTMD